MATVVTAVVVVVAAAGACSDSTRSTRAESPSSVGGSSATSRHGAVVYERDCEACHGATGDRVPAAPLSSKAFLDSRGDATLLAVVADGKGTMPGFSTRRGGPLDDDEVRDVVAYLNDAAGRESTTALAAAGGGLYESNCLSCHGPAGDRIPIAPLDAQGFLDSRTDAQLVDAILNGRATMKGFGGEGAAALDEGDAQALVAYLRYRVLALTMQSVSHGRDLYVDNCLACHGADGRRVADVDLASAPYLQGAGDGAIVAAVNEGTTGSPAFGMGYGGGFAITDTTALLAYLKSWAGLDATTALIQGAGGTSEQLFLTSCASCHGNKGDQVPGVELLSATFLAQTTRDVVTRTVTVGNDAGMPAWGREAGGPLSEEEVAAVVEYLFATAGVTLTAAADEEPASEEGDRAEAPRPFGDNTAAEFYGSNCAGCHGVDREGGVGPALLPDRLTESDQFYFDTISQGRPGTAMPAWTDQGLSDAQISALVALLRGSAEGDEAGSDEAGSEDAATDDAAAAEPLFDGATAAEFFAAKCAACHGAERQGGVGPALLPDGLAEADDFYVDTILEGRPGTAMPAWNVQGVSEEQARALVAFIKSEPGGSASRAPAAPEPVVHADDLDTTVFDGSSVIDFYAANCAACHGADRQGGIAPALFADRLTKSDAFYTRTILAGRPGTPMPAWSEQGVTDEQAQALVNFIRRETQVAAVEPTQALTSWNTAGLYGRALFEATCALCHGADGLSVSQCPIGSSPWLANVGDSALIMRISRGKPSQGMPTWSDAYGGPLTFDQVRSVAVYLAQIAR
jgi:mono/diheme cytochrome c family protein